MPGFTASPFDIGPLAISPAAGATGRPTTTVSFGPSGSNATPIGKFAGGGGPIFLHTLI